MPYVGMGALLPWAGRKKFRPSQLFATGAQGAWFDPSDLSSMYQDSAGVTPVTAVEQPVGLRLDKSKGMVRGVELAQSANIVTATGYDNTTTPAGLGFTAVGVTTATRSVVNFATVPNKTYEVTFTRGASTQAPTPFAFSGAGGTGSVLASVSTSDVRCIFTATTSASSFGWVTSTPQTFTISGISVRDLAGNHATQATSTSRPKLSARVNLIDKSDQFDDAAWTKRGATTVTANAIVGPYGAQNADLISNVGALAVNDIFFAAYTTSRGPASTSIKPGIWFKRSTTAGTLRISNPNATTSGLWEVNLAALSDSWEFLTPTHAAVTVLNPYILHPANGGMGVHFYMVSGSANFYLGGADVRTADDAARAIPAYQRVNTSTDYDTAGFPLFLAYDGVDDGMATGNVDFTGTDTVSVFAAVRKNSDAARGMLVRLTSAGVGAFQMEAPPGAAASQFSFRSLGTLTAQAASASSYAAPISAVLSGLGQISTDTCRLRVNQTEFTTAADQGTGNYSSGALELGMQIGGTLPFNGRDYGLIILGRTAMPSEITRAERWLAARAGVVL